MLIDTVCYVEYCIDMEGTLSPSPLTNTMNSTLTLIDWSEKYPELSSADIAKLQSTYCTGCSKNVGIEKIGFMKCASCSK